jgi:hypothetical protein
MGRWFTSFRLYVIIILSVLHAVAEGALSVVVNGNPIHRLSTWGTFGEMALVDTDYVNCATVVVESHRARLLAAHTHSIDLLDLRSIYSCYRFAAQLRAMRASAVRTGEGGG